MEKIKAVGHLNANKQPLRSHEMIYMFHNPIKPKDLQWIYNPQKITGAKPRIYKEDNKEMKNGTYSMYKQTRYANDGTIYPKSILKLGFANNTIIHSTQKPLELCEWLIKTYSNEGDLVLDFTMGSGTTIVAAINTKRKYIGIEMNEEIYKKAEERINQE